jgi:hypothetical protein
MIGHEGPLRLREPKPFSANHGFKFCFEPQLQIFDSASIDRRGAQVRRQ